MQDAPTPMTAADLTVLYGTASASPVPDRLEAGPLAIDLADGMITRVGWRGAEVLRGIAYPVRNRDWGTCADRTIRSAVARRADGLTYHRAFDTADGALSGSFTCSLDSNGRLHAHVTFRAVREAVINRAGFVVLHPIAAAAGTPLTITHADGTRTRTAWPRQISPGQPARNIRALDYDLPGVRVRLNFQGDVFEMEDQRNWTDASFKTYCRPLALPYPYLVREGSVWDQDITLDLSGPGAARRHRGAENRLSIGLPDGIMPHVALAATEDWGSAAMTPPAGSVILWRADLRQGPAAARCADIVAQAQRPVEIEAILPDDARLAQRALAELGERLHRLAARPRSLTVLPAAYLASHQPDGPWPPGVTPAQARAWAVAHFPELPVGFGVFTNFTELNRLPERADDPAFVTYATTAIVHAADDLSVMQTLEALPQVHGSAAALYPGCPLRLGLVGIGMRSNPYGAACAPNPDNRRVACAMDDPRQRGVFAAAFMVGAVAATIGSAVARMALGSQGGPFALLAQDGTARPAWHVFRALAALSGAARLAVDTPAGLTAVAAALPDGGARLIVANTTPSERQLDLPPLASSFVLDHRNASLCADPALDLPLVAPTGGRVRLGPHAVLFAEVREVTT
jgi:D-apionolactonase